MTAKEFCMKFEQLQRVHDDFIALESQNQNLVQEVASNPLNDEEIRVAVSDVLKTADSITDELALRMMKLYPEWQSNVTYNVNDRIQYAGTLYKCLQGHISQDNWTPTESPSLWAKVLIPNPNVVPEWEQPESTNPYMVGDKVTYNGETYVCTIDNNVWNPTTYGWSKE